MGRAPRPDRGARRHHRARPLQRRPFAVAALVAGGTVRIRTWPTETTQVGADLETLLPLWGATVTRDGDDLVFDGGVGVAGGASLPGVELDLTRGGELAPALVALAALADAPSEITGIGHLRGHETDRSQRWRRT